MKEDLRTWIGRLLKSLQGGPLTASPGAAVLLYGDASGIGAGGYLQHIITGQRFTLAMQSCTPDERKMSSNRGRSHAWKASSQRRYGTS